MLRLVLCIVALIAPPVALQSVRSERVDSIDIGRVPQQLGEFRVVDTQMLEPNVEAMLSPASYWMRLYRAPDGTAIWAFASAYTGDEDGGAHAPEVCYPAQGWDIHGREPATIQLDDGAELPVQVLQAQHRKQAELVIHWVQKPGRWPAAEGTEEILQVIDAFRGSPQYAFVRLSIAHPETDALDHLSDLARRMAPHVRALLENPSAEPMTSGS